MKCMCFSKNNIVTDKTSNRIVDSIADINIQNNLQQYFLKNKIKNKNIFDIENFNHKILGTGGASTTYKININNSNYTCKCINKDNTLLKKNALREIELLKKINNKHFPNYCSDIKNKNGIYIFYNYIDGIDLFEIIDNKYEKIENIDTQLSIIYEISKGLYSLFTENLVHLDLKPENILITNYDPIKLKIIDLECMHDIRQSKLKRVCGTIGYVAPELLFSQKYYHNSDIWSLGCIFFLLLSRFNIFNLQKETYENDLKNYIGIYFIHKTITTELVNYSNDIIHLLSNMLKIHHIERFTVNNILKCDIMKKFDKYV